MEEGFGRNRGFRLEVRELADPLQRVDYLARLRVELRLVGQVLETAAATLGKVGAGRVDTGAPASTTSSAVASAWLRFTFVTRARTVSPGSPRRTKTTKPFRRATPFPP